MGGSWRRRMGESLGKTGAPTMLYENLDLLTWSLQISTPCALAYFTATNPLPAVPISHPTPPAPAAGRILPVPRVVRENGPGRPRITPPARTLASRPPTLSQLFPSHVPHPLHPLQVEFYWYHGWCARTSRVAPESPPPRLRSLHGRQLSLSCFHLTSYTPCTRCRLIFTDTMGGARGRTGSPQIHSPCALARFTPSIEFGIVGNRQTS